MKRFYNKFLLLALVAVFTGTSVSTILAKDLPATPEKFGIEVNIKESHPVKGDITLFWHDGDVKSELGDYFRITQFKQVDNEIREERVGKVERIRDNNNGGYKFVIKDLPPAEYCYVVDLWDSEDDIASRQSEKACGTVGKNTDPERDMFFNCKAKFIPLGNNGTGSFFVDVENNTNCNFEIRVIESDLTIEIAEFSKDGALIDIAADEKGKYMAVLGLVDKCTDELVDKVELLICYGDCINNEERMHFATDNLFIKLDENGVASSSIRVINDTKCEWEIRIIESKVKIAISEQSNDMAVLKFQADEKGKYHSVIGLVNKCSGDVVSKMNIDICYGDCEPPKRDIDFAKNTLFHHRLTEAESWKYDIDAVSEKDCRLTYHLSDDTGGNNNVPEGLRLNEETGVMSWEKPIKGGYFITVIVKSTCDGGVTYTSIEGGFFLSVEGTKPDFTSILNCRFYDETDDVKEFHGRVTIWSADNRDPNTPSGHSFVISTDLNGNSISVKLPEGKYYLKVEAKGYKQQYYETAFELINAKTIGVGDNDEVSIEMMLHRLPTPDLFEITGQVTDRATGEPVPSMVTFMPVKWVLGGKEHDDPNGFTFENTVRTDEKGNYSIKLPNTWSYYGSAEAIPTNAKRYKKQYYEGADTYYEADIIYLEEDLTGINFKLVEHEAHQGFISGSVTDKENNIVQSTVIALSIDNEGVGFKEVTKTDEKGNYYFQNLRYGKYILLSLPQEYSYYPGYFVMGDFATLKWSEATVISVGDINPSVMYQITHKSAAEGREKGIARIIGRIIKRFGGVSPGSDPDDNSISGGIVTLTNETGDIVNYYITDNNGFFELDGLQPGTYTMSVDKVGFDSYSETVEVDYSDAIELETEIELSQSISSVDYTGFDKVKLVVSPMPVKDVSTISFDGVAGNSNIRLVDMAGNIIYQTNISTIDGLNEFSFDAKEVQSGAYVLVIENGETAIAGGITIIK